MDRFELQGIVYYQQGRKCGKPDCACTSYRLHGPYWYSRDVAHNKVSYLGKGLPDKVTQARKSIQKNATRIVDKIAALHKQRDSIELQIVALNHLLNGKNVDDYTATIRHLGFGKCLVSEAGTDRTQGQHKTEMVTA